MIAGSFYLLYSKVENYQSASQIVYSAENLTFLANTLFEASALSQKH